MMSPYTVVIPAYNAAPLIAETLDSLMAQSCPPQRIIVVDDGSPDETAAVVRSYRGPVTYVRQDHVGPGAATTRGIMMVETEMLATVDHDDLWLPRKAELQLARLAADAGLAAVFARMAEFSGDPSGAHYESAYDGWTRATLMMRTSIARANGPMLDHPGRLGEVIEWLAILRENGHRLAMMDETLALRRLHPGSLSSRSRGELSQSYLLTARRALERRRARAGSQ